ncbi:MAG TPA: hypothetical protein VHQ87_02660 [Rhizobacter sp.]|nr:hypothetical protein [Rhizobacter sp.]
MCCGSNRAAARAAVMAQAAQASQVPAPAAAGGAANAVSVIMFEYLGHGDAVIRGPVSGRVYRFARSGERQQVDARDRPGLAAMPVLRWVR